MAALALTALALTLSLTPSLTRTLTPALALSLTLAPTSTRWLKSYFLPEGLQAVKKRKQRIEQANP